MTELEVADDIARLRSELDQAEVMERIELRDGDRQSARYWAKVAADRRESLEGYGVPVYVSDDDEVTAVYTPSPALLRAATR